MEPSSVQTLVLGVGNKLMADEGVGVHVIERLAETYRIPEEVQILDGRTLGMDLLYYLEGVPNLLIIDAVQANRDPGSVIRLEGDDVPSFLSLKISPHQIGVPDMLAAARLKDIYPKRIVLIGIQPELIDLGLELSPLIEALVPDLVEQVVQQLRAWGHSFAPAA